MSSLLHKLTTVPSRELFVLRESVKVLCDRASTVLFGEKHGDVAQTLLMQASKQPYARHLNWQYLLQHYEELFELMTRLRFAVAFQGYQPSAEKIVVIERDAKRLVRLLSVIFERTVVLRHEGIYIESDNKDAINGEVSSNTEQTASSKAYSITETEETTPFFSFLQSQIVSFKRLYERHLVKRLEPHKFLALQLSLHGNEMEVRVFGNEQGLGEAKERVKLPFVPEELDIIINSLDREIIDERFTNTSYFQALQGSIFNGNRLKEDACRYIGEILFKALFCGSVYNVYRSVSKSSKMTALQLRFDAEHAILAQYPWELIFDWQLGEHVVAMNKGVELYRFINFTEPPRPLKTQFPLRVLFISPRKYREERTYEEKFALFEALKPSLDSELIVWQDLRPPTWHKLEETLNAEQFDIIHFDGFGSIRRFCGSCGYHNQLETTCCAKCGEDVSAIDPQSYVVFEQEGPGGDRITSTDLAHLLVNSDTRLIVLNVRKSGNISGKTLFNGLAPGLSRAGIPAVIGLQGDIKKSIKVKFTKRFYKALLDGLSIPAAVNSGRLRILRDRPPAWFLPVVYLRCNDEDKFGTLVDL